MGFHQINVPRPGVKEIVGRKLAGRIRRLSPTFRALLAHEMESGRVIVHALSRKQAVQLTGASVGYVNTIHRLSDEQRELLKRGALSLSKLHSSHKSLTDAEIDHLVIKLGPERIMRALDRYTQPQRFAAE
jgi:hypothetical protein